MKLVVMSVFDRALGAFGRPFTVPARGIGVRSFGDEINNPQSEFHKHPADYELWQLGEYEDATGDFSLGKAKERVCLGVDMVKEVSS